MTSSIRRWMSFANRLLIDSLAITGIPSKDFWAVVMFSCEHTHEPEPGGAVEIAWVEQDCWHRDPALQLLQQREGAVDREQGTGSHDEHDLTERVRLVGHLRSDQINQGRILRKHRMYGLDDRACAVLALRGKPFFE